MSGGVTCGNRKISTDKAQEYWVIDTETNGARLPLFDSITPKLSDQDERFRAYVEAT
jgi:hypothetical protein